MHTLRKITLLTLICLITGSIFAQDVPPGFKTWAATGLRVRLSPKTSISGSQLTAFNMRPSSFQFTQANLSIGHRIGERWNLDLGAARSWFKSSETIKTYNRVFAEVDYKIKWGELGMKQSLRAEYHFPQIRKYRTRFIYSNKLSYRFKKLPLRPQPFIRHQLYWYQGGKNVKYYDEESGELEVSQPANGFHRYRFTIGVRARLAKRLYGSLFYTWQREFNLPFNDFRALNVTKPNGKVQAPFNNYSLVGFSLSYTLKLY